MNKFTSAIELSKKICSGDISVKENLDEYFDRIEKINKKLNCFITVCRDEAYAQGKEVQKRIDSGEELSPLAGIPIGIKDNICTKGIRTTCASKILDNFVPTYDATVIKKLKDSGMIIVGKLNMDEFAMGSTTETSAYGAALNPWDISRVPGGSSGGSAVSVASGAVPLSLGSDTGGSVRQPCSFCGVTGIKPTYGAVSRYGLIAYASSLDQIGCVGTDTKDCEALFSIIKGKDEKDSTSLDFSAGSVQTGSLRGKKIALINQFFNEGLNGEVAEAVQNAARVYEKLGAEIVNVPMDIVKYAIPTYYIVACAEASSNLSRYDGIKYGYLSPEAENLASVYVKSRSEGFGIEVKRRIMLGNFVLSSGYYDAYYNKALKAKQLISRSFKEIFSNCDMILAPVYPTTAMKLGESISDPLKLYLGDIYTVMVNLAGLPSLALPCGFDSDNLPIGCQLIGDYFSEYSLFEAGKLYQQNSDHHIIHPTL